MSNTFPDISISVVDNAIHRIKNKIIHHLKLDNKKNKSVINTVEQLRLFLAMKIFRWTDEAYAENFGEPLSNWRPDISHNEFMEIWNRLDDEDKRDAVLHIVPVELCGRGVDEQDWAVAALNATPLTLCIAVARALGEEVEIKERYESND